MGNFLVKNCFRDSVVSNPWRLWFRSSHFNAVTRAGARCIRYIWSNSSIRCLSFARLYKLPGPPSLFARLYRRRPVFVQCWLLRWVKLCLNNFCPVKEWGKGLYLLCFHFVLLKTQQAMKGGSFTPGRHGETFTFVPNALFYLHGCWKTQI